MYHVFEGYMMISWITLFIHWVIQSDILYTSQMWEGLLWINELTIFLYFIRIIFNIFQIHAWFNHDIIIILNMK